jgi:putative two-component system response regulator
MISVGMRNVYRVRDLELPRCTRICAGTCRGAERSRLHALLLLSRTLEATCGTRDHARRARALTLRLAAAAGIPVAMRAEIGLAALLHDIGKVLIPEVILQKPGPLTDEERAMVQQHPVHGAAITYAVPGMQELSLLIRHHHERWDGAGYPDGLAGEEIPLGARVIAVVDVWDALTHDRPYRRALGIAEARAIMLEGRGAQFDPKLVDCFLTLI